VGKGHSTHGRKRKSFNICVVKIDLFRRIENLILNRISAEVADAMNTWICASPLVWRAVMELSVH
jgi:hypothetical protein